MRFVKRAARAPDARDVDWFTWTLLVAVPVLYGLFWWLDYHWLRQERERELPATPLPDDD